MALDVQVSHIIEKREALKNIFPLSGRAGQAQKPETSLSDCFYEVFSNLKGDRVINSRSGVKNSPTQKYAS